jgi:hypothetical protein
MRVVRCGVPLLALAVSAGCATIAHGSRQTVTVTSDPPGAAVTVLSKQTVKSTPGVTPITLELTRRDPDITLRFERDGCQPVDVRLKRSASAWLALNLVVANPFAMQGYDHDAGAQYAKQVAVGVPLMFAADVATGAAFKLPKAVNVRLCGP